MRKQKRTLFVLMWKPFTKKWTTSKRSCPCSKIDTISPQDLYPVREARLPADLALRAAEVAQLKVFVKYGLTEADSFDVATGRIIRPEVEGEALP